MNAAEKNTLEIIRAEIRAVDAVLNLAMEHELSLKMIHTRAVNAVINQRAAKRDLQTRFDEMMADTSPKPPTSESP